MGRRGTLGVGMSAAAALLLLGGRKAPAQTPPKTMQAHLDLVTVLGITPDGKTLVSGSRDKRIKLWSLPEGQLLFSTSRGSSDPGISNLAITPDGTLAALSQGTTHFIVSIAERRLLGTMSNPLGSTSPARALVISPDGRTVAADSNLEIRLWSPTERGQPRILAGHTGQIQALVFLPDGRLASGAADGTIRIWSVTDRRLLSTLTGHGGTVAALAVSADGATLVSGSLDGRLAAWSVPAGRVTATLQGENNPVPDSRSYMYWSTDNDRWIAPLPMLEWSTIGSRILALAPDGRTVAFSPDGRGAVWATDGPQLASLDGEKRRIHGLLVTRDGRTLVSWGSDGTIELRGLPDGEVQATLHAGIRVHVAALTPDGRMLVSGHPGGVILLWDLEKRELLGSLFDPAANRNEALSYNVFDGATGRTLTYTVPCGTPLPAGAMCTCNCVPGTYRPTAPSQPPSGGGGGGGGGCICNSICTCVPVFR